MQYGKVFDWSIKADMIGRPAMDSAEYVIKALGLPIPPAGLFDAAQGGARGASRPPPGHPGSRSLHPRAQRAGIPTAVATSTDARLFEIKTQPHRTWFSIFDKVVCGDDPRGSSGASPPPTSSW